MSTFFPKMKSFFTFFFIIQLVFAFFSHVHSYAVPFNLSINVQDEQQEGLSPDLLYQLKDLEDAFNLQNVSFNKEINESTIIQVVNSLDSGLNSLSHSLKKHLPEFSFNGTILGTTFQGMLTNITMGKQKTYRPLPKGILILKNVSSTAILPEVSHQNETRLPSIPLSISVKNNENVNENGKISNRNSTVQWLRVLKEDFLKGLSPIVWKTVKQCEPGQLTCFTTRPQNLLVQNKTLIITPMAAKKSSPLQYTSARIYTTVHWPFKFRKFKVHIRADLPTADSVVPILKVIVNQTLEFQLIPPQINSISLTNLTFQPLPSLFQVTLDRVTGEVRFGNENEDSMVHAVVPKIQSNTFISIVLSLIIRTSDTLPRGPIIWAGPSEEASVVDIYKRQLVDLGDDAVFTMTVRSVEVFFSKPGKYGPFEDEEVD